jgi:nucleotide-binding universal stress UspA family protein
MTWLPRQTVVVPIDFSEESLAALETARELSRGSSKLHVVHVLPVLEPTEPGIIWHTIDDGSRGRHAEAAMRKVLGQRPLGEVEIVVRFGDPGHEIAHYAKELPADLIVLPSHGRRGLTRLLLGSVTDRVIHLAHCPVLVLKQ